MCFWEAVDREQRYQHFCPPTPDLCFRCFRSVLPALSAFTQQCSKVTENRKQKKNSDADFQLPGAGRGAGLWRGALIGSDDPEQPLRAGWQRVCTVNYTSPSEHRGSEDGGAAWGRAQVAVERSAAYGCSQPHTGGYIWRYLLTYWTSSLYLTTGKYWQRGNEEATLNVIR